MPRTEKLVSLLTSSSMLFKLHLWDIVSGVQVRFIPFYSSRNLWCDLLPAKAYISPAPLSWKVFFRVTALTLHLCLLWFIFPPCTSPVEHAGISLYSFSKGKPLHRASFDISWLQRVLVYCAAPWLEMLLELGWLLPDVRQEGNGCWMGTCTAQGFRVPTPQWQQGNVDVCTKPEAGDWQVMGVNISWKHTASSRDKFPYWWVYYLWSPRENQQLHLINTPSDFCLFGGFILLFIFLD